MRHHQTRRKGRKNRTTHLRKNRITYRRTQRGGAEITSAMDWFKAINDFEERETSKGTFLSDYTIDTLTSPEFVLPITDPGEGKFTIPGVNTIFPPIPKPEDYEDPSPEDMSLLDIAQIVSYVFNGEGSEKGLRSKGYNTYEQFLQYTNAVKDISDNTDNPVDFENKQILWFLNEIEVALQNASGKKDERKFTSIYDTTKFPFYIMYLAANPIRLPEKPLLEKIDNKILEDISSTVSEPVVPTA